MSSFKTEGFLSSSVILLSPEPKIIPILLFNTNNLFDLSY